MKKILIVERGSLSASVYTPSRSVFCRLHEPFFYLKENNLLPFEVDFLRTDQINDDNIKQYRIVIFCKHNTEDSVKVARLAKKYGIKVFYDVDDLIHKFTEDSAAFVYMNNLPYLKEHLETADLVVSENKTLGSLLCADFAIQDNVVLPTGINTDKYFKSHYQPTKSNVLFTNGDNLKLVFFREKFTEIFNAFLNKYSQVEFQVFGDSEEYVKPFVRYDFLGALPWGEHKKWLAKEQAEFAIVPLGASEEDSANQLFSDCKTPIKFMEYGALRIPGIYSDTPIYKNVIENRYSGLLVENTAEAWEAALEEMHLNAELRKKITDNALEAVRNNHHIAVSAKKWLEIIS